MEHGFLLILMYHQLFTGKAGVDRYSISVEAFRRQVGMLAEKGFRSVVPETLAQERGGRLVMFSFDDGYASDLELAQPVLSAAGFRGVSFITTSFLGRRGYLSWEQCARLNREGFSVQSHTHTHPLLEACQAARLRYELRHSKELLEDRLGCEVSALSLPGGSLPKTIRDEAWGCGYRYVFSSMPGIHRLPVDETNILRRLRVDREVTEAAFGRITDGDIGMYRGVAAGYFLRRGVRKLIGTKAYHHLWLRFRKYAAACKE